MAKTIKELTQDLLQAPSACKEVKEAAQNYPGKLSRICEIQSAVTSEVLLDAAIRYIFPASYSFLKVVSSSLCMASSMAFLDFFMPLHF